MTESGGTEDDQENSILETELKEKVTVTTPVSRTPPLLSPRCTGCDRSGGCFDVSRMASSLAVVLAYNMFPCGDVLFLVQSVCDFPTSVGLENIYHGKYYHETDELPNPRPTQPKKK